MNSAERCIRGQSASKEEIDGSLIACRSHEQFERSSVQILASLLLRSPDRYDTAGEGGYVRLYERETRLLSCKRLDIEGAAIMSSANYKRQPNWSLRAKVTLRYCRRR